MKKFVSQIVEDQRGSALLTSILFMMILLLLTFSVNYMLLKDIRSQTNFVQGQRAYFASEAGVESGMLDVSLVNKGVEFPTETTGMLPEGESYEYDIVSRGEVVPCEHEDQNESGYAVLKTGESVAIPLDVDTFQVEFYVVNRENPDTIMTDIATIGDVLRWRIMGNRDDLDHQVEAISGYVPASVNANSHDNPTVLGTNPSGSSDPSANYTTGAYIELVEGATYDTLLDLGLFDTGFLYISEEDSFAEATDHYIFHPEHQIASFLANHENEYLMLTNFLNLVLSTDPNLDLAYDASAYDLYYKVRDAQSGSSVACSSVMVSSDGWNSNQRFVQSLDVVRKLENPLPFADFGWYQR